MHVALLGRFAVAGHAHLARMLKTPWTITPLPDETPSVIAGTLAEIDALVGLEWNAGRPPAPKMRFLQVSAAGLDKVDLAAVPKGVTVCNAFGHEDGMAEFTLMAMLLWQHQFIAIQEIFRGGSWASGQARGRPHGEVAGQTVAIIGTGRLGRAVALRCKPMGMRVIGVNRSPITDTHYDEKLGLDRLDEALARCDFAVVCVGLTPATQGLIGARQLAAMKPTGVIINLARGLVIDEEPLYRALAEKRIGGAVIDTWYRYPTPQDPDPRPSAFPFHELPNVMISPHTAAFTTGLLERRWSQIAANLDRFACGEPVENVVTRT